MTFNILRANQISVKNGKRMNVKKREKKMLEKMPRNKYKVVVRTLVVCRHFNKVWLKSGYKMSNQARLCVVVREKSQDKHDCLSRMFQVCMQLYVARNAFAMQ